MLDTRLESHLMKIYQGKQLTQIPFRFSNLILNLDLKTAKIFKKHRKCPIFQLFFKSGWIAEHQSSKFKFNGPPDPPPPTHTHTHFHRPCTVLLSFLLLQYIVSGSDLFADHALCLWGEKLGAILAKQRSNQVTTHILLPSLLASITGGQIPCRSVSLRTHLLWYCRLTLDVYILF